MLKVLICKQFLTLFFVFDSNEIFIAPSGVQKERIEVNSLYFQSKKSFQLPSCFNLNLFSFLPSLFNEQKIMLILMALLDSL